MEKGNTRKDSAVEPPKSYGALTSVSRKFTVAIAALVIACMCIFWLISNYNTQNLLRQQADTMGITLARQTAALVTELVLANDLISMNVVLSQLTEGSAIVEAAVLNIDGEVIAISTTQTQPSQSLIPVSVSFGEYTAPVLLQDSTAGNVRVRLDTTYIEAGIANNLLFVGVAALILLIVAVMLSITYFQYLVSFPVKLLNFGLQGVREGDLEHCPEPDNNNEIGRVIRQFNATVDFLDHYAFISAKVPDKKAKKTAEPASEEEFTGAFLCIRLTNFQYLSSTHDSKHMVTLLNRYYYVAEYISGLYNGSISYCMDGEVIIGFTQGQLDDEQCFYAVCAGQLFLRLLSTIIEIEEEEKPINAKFRLAAHFGNSTPGLYSPMSQEYDIVSGDDLDLARQICNDCPDNSLLVSEPAYTRAGSESRVIGEEYSIVEVDPPFRTYLCSHSMSGYRLLLDKQARRIQELLPAA